VSTEEEARIKEIHRQARGCSTANSEKKDRILLKLFSSYDMTSLMLQLYRGVLQQHKNFAKLFQSEKLVLHKLHVRLYTLTRDFLSLFIKADMMPQEHSVSALKKIDCTKEENQVADKDLVVGGNAYRLYHKLRKDPKQQYWMKKFQQQLRQGYVNACVSMLVKLPLNNRTLSNLTALDPEMQQSEDTSRGLIKLAECLPNIVSDKEIGQLLMEARRYTCDLELKSLTPETDDIDKSWWNPISQLRATGSSELRYPILSRLAKAVLSVFAGPIIEGTFNIMDDIVESDRTSLTAESYEALALTKFALKAKKETSCSMKITHKMRVSATSAHANYVAFLEKKKGRIKERREELIQQAVNNSKATSSKPSAAPTKPACAMPKQSGERVPTKNSAKDSAAASAKPPVSHTCPFNFTIPKKSGKVDGQTPNKKTHSAKPSAPAETCTSQSSARKEYFKNLSQDLQQAAQHSFAELKKAAGAAETEMTNKWPVTCMEGLEASHYREDCHAADLYPSDAPRLIPIQIYGDGNCLPRSASLLACGSEDKHVEMRVRMTIELAIHDEFYLSDVSLSDPNVPESVQWSTEYASYSQQFQRETLSPEGNRNIYHKEVTQSIVPGTYLGMWFLHAVSSILRTPIQSVYPQFGGQTVRKHLQRQIYPRIGAHNTGNLPTIMWSRLHGKDLAEERWHPNHFVVCLPGPRRPNPSQKRKASGPHDIRDFFTKRPKP
jgi:hypothetical protein